MTCKICSGALAEIQVANTPVSGYRCNTLQESQSQPSFDLTLQFCNSCKMICYKYHPDAEPVLDKLYSGHTATYYFTPVMNEYMNGFVNSLASKYSIGAGSNVLEIGCNSGRMLSIFKEKTGCNVYGVEPSRTFQDLWKEQGLTVINEYFNKEISQRLSSVKFDLIFFRHVYEHIPDPLTFFNDVASLCNDRTVIIIEVPYFISVMEKKRIENISYSHLNYYTVQSIDSIIRKSGMGILHFEKVSTDGGSMVVHIRKGIKTDPAILDNIQYRDVVDFIGSIKIAEEKIKSILATYRKEEIAGYGAGAKGQHLIYILHLQDCLQTVVDDTPGYEKKYIPGTSIMIEHPDYLKTGKIKAVINLAPTHSEAIRAKVPGNMKFIDII